ncbi:restriction endonuclease subunit S [Streptococcus thoraltensis]
MSDWKLKDILVIKNGSKYDMLHSGEVPVYGSGGIITYVNDFLYDGDSILLPRKGTLDNIIFSKGKIWTVDTMYHTVIDDTKICPYFLYQMLKSLDFSQLYTGSTIPSMTSSAYYGITIPKIPLPTQQKIASLLSSLDEKIALNNRINKELEQMAKELYDYWFVQFDFPDENGKPYKSSGGEMIYHEVLKREIPKGWEVKKLGEYAEVEKGKLITDKEADSSGTFKVVSAGLDFSYYHSEPNRDANVITISASGANAGFIRFWREQIFANDCTTVQSNIPEGTFFIYQYLLLLQSHIYKQARGSAQPHVYPKDIEDLSIVIPKEALMNEYANITKSINIKIRDNEFENRNLAQLRDWLLPMLMNGQVRIED